MACEVFLESYGFDSRRDLEVWRLHTDGLATREISSRLNSAGLKISSATVKTTIARLNEAMKSGLFFGDE